MRGAFPRFDLVLLGLGVDGHTASLFPGTEAVRERERIVCPVRVARLGSHRISLTPPALNSAAAVLFLVSGAGKADTVRSVLKGERRPDLLPSQAVHPLEGELLWLVDRAAARLIEA
jgi:6-phosphogluconolactonase